MAATLPTEASHDTQAVPVRRIEVSDLWIALRQGFDDFLHHRGDIFFLGLIYPFVGIFTGLMARQENAIQLFFPLVAGIALLGPAVAAIFYEVARRRERGENPSWREAFGLIRRSSFDGLVTLAGVLAVVFMLWMLTAWAIYAWTLGPEPPVSVGQFVRDLFGTPAGWTMIIVGNLMGLLFAAAALAVGVASFPMLVDRPVSAATALNTSLRATARNAGPLAVWGVIVVALLVLGTIPLFVGLAVVVPVLGYATWHLYTRMVER